MSENSQDETMGNQQGKMHFNIGWLVGMVEGEGSITLTRSAKAKNKFGHKITPHLSITGTNDALMEKATEVIKFFKLPFSIDKRKNSNPNWKDTIRIQVYGLRRVEQWLFLLYPYLVGKKEQAETVLQFIENRKRVLTLHPWHKPYTNEDLVLYEKVHKLNGRLGRSAKPSETKRRPGKPPEKI